MDPRSRWTQSPTQCLCSVYIYGGCSSLCWFTLFEQVCALPSQGGWLPQSRRSYTRTLQLHGANDHRPNFLTCNEKNPKVTDERHHNSLHTQSPLSQPAHPDLAPAPLLSRGATTLGTSHTRPQHLHIGGRGDRPIVEVNLVPTDRGAAAVLLLEDEPHLVLGEGIGLASGSGATPGVGITQELSWS